MGWPFQLFKQFTNVVVIHAGLLAERTRAHNEWFGALYLATRFQSEPQDFIQRLTEGAP